MKKNLIRAGAIALLASSAVLAQAQTVTMTGWAYGSGNAVVAIAPSGLFDIGNAGGFKGSLSGFGAFDTRSFTTYCVDMAQSFNLPSVMTGYSIISAASDTGSFASGGWGSRAAATSERLGQLFTYVNSHPTLVDTAAESTALQLAIWNTIYDTDNTVGSGAFFTGAATFNTYGAAANNLLSASLDTVSNLSVYVLHSAEHQDFILTTTAVPEPGTYALMLAGLGCVGFVARRRGARA